MTRAIPAALIVAAAAMFVSVSVANFDSAGAQAAAAGPEEKKATAPKYTMVAELHVVMEHVDDLFYGIEDLSKAGKFKKIRQSAQIIAELTNVSTYSKEFAAKKGWADACKKAASQLMEMSKAAKAKDKAKVDSLFQAAEATCDNCHETYRD